VASSQSYAGKIGSSIVAIFFTSEAPAEASCLKNIESISFHLLMTMPPASEGLRIAALFSWS
jgi:hypothetical protein